MYGEYKKLRNVPHVIAKSMNPLTENVISGITCHTKETNSVRLHIDLGSYSADIPGKTYDMCTSFESNK